MGTILPGVLDPAKGTGVAMLFLEMVGVAKGQPRGTPRGVRRQASRLVGVLKQPEVRVDLTGEIWSAPPHAEQVQQAFGKTTHWGASYPSSSRSLLTSADSRRQRTAWSSTARRPAAVMV